jgi:translation initiation factor eIF-2B subunit epsilon
MKKKSKGSGAEDPADRKRHEQPLQAVLLADDWSSSSSSSSSSSHTDASMRLSFYPLALDRPKVLSPLLNITLLEYVINYLTGQGVKELYVVCATSAVEEYLLQYTKQIVAMQNHSFMEIVVIRDATVLNAGDALRELDKRNVIQSDPFVLLHGDCLTNMDLSEAMVAHRHRHVADSSAIFTMLLKSVGSVRATSSSSYSALRSTGEDLVVGLDPAHDNRVLLYDNHIDRRSVTVPCSFFASHCSELEIRTDLLDVGIDLCSPEVLARFSDEFDYRDIRREFVVNSVSEEEEGLQNKLYAHIVPTATYAARIHDARTYHAVSHDLLRRLAFPIVPDHGPVVLTTHEPQTYAMQRDYLYYETTGRTRVGRSSVVSGPGMIGTHCFVGEDCQIRSSVIGSHCHVADHCIIQDSYLWEGVQVEAGARIQQSILAAGVVVKAGAVVSRGCIVGAGCVIGTNICLPEYTRLTCSLEVHDVDFDDDWGDDDDEEEEDDDDEDNELATKTEGVSIMQNITSDYAVVGSDGKGWVWLPATNVDNEQDDDDDEDAENRIPVDLLLKSQCIGFDPQKIIAERLRLEAKDDDELSLVDVADSKPLDDDNDGYDDGGITFGDGPVSNAAVSIVGRQEGVDVVKELKIICLEFEAGTSPIENLAIELNSYKFSQNASYSDCTMAAMLAILERMAIHDGMTDGKLVTEFKAYLDKWAPLLQKMSVGLDEEKAIVLALEQSAVGDTAHGSDEDDRAARVARSSVLSSGMSFRLLLQMLHDQEIVSEEAILAWAADRKEEDGEKDSARGRLFRLQPVQDFLEWLDEESDDDNDDEEEDED